MGYGLERSLTFKTHLALGALGAICFVGAVDRAENIYIFGLILLGSVLPDIDEPRSFISRKFPLISRVAATFFTHRGPTHFLFIPVLLFVAWAIFGYLALGAIGFGMIIHHLGDMLTPSGIYGYFYPFKRKFVARILPKNYAIKTGSKLELTLVLPSVLMVDGVLGAMVLGFDIDMANIIKILNLV
ncbi:MULTISPECIES: metal-dependent hydrolase [Campylobacter]|uniref:metal-dependent hydrolase n=1 Tax=Campylobacter TaxID=194 RepID=UPI0015D94499|nr:metal-dependent hydrolase [Campylobacter sp. P0124]MCR8696919.1 metal-dependent hydrolase [Campylobacter sp. RM19073]